MKMSTPFVIETQQVVAMKWSSVGGEKCEVCSREAKQNTPAFRIG
jgi:hypothetical protein